MLFPENEATYSLQVIRTHFKKTDQVINQNFVSTNTKEWVLHKPCLTTTTQQNWNSVTNIFGNSKKAIIIKESKKNHNENPNMFRLDGH